jgi:integrase/recombinase XerC
MKDTFEKYIGQFLDYLKAERNASQYTIRNYKRDLGIFAECARQAGVKTPRKVDKSLVRSFLNSITAQGFARASIARHMSAIRSFFRYLQREEIISKNPAATISSPKLDRRLPSFLTVEEIRHLIEMPDQSLPQGQRDAAMLELFYAAGLRISELVSMNVEQVDLNTKEILIRGKGSRERIVLIGDYAARALNVYLDNGRPQLLGDKNNEALFVNRYGGRLPARRVQKILEKYAGLINKKVHPHMLRHTFATHLLDGGADLRVVQELLGHASLTSTQIYTHVTRSQARKIYLSAHPMAQENKDADK